MKKVLFSLSLLAMIAGAVSCSSTNPEQMAKADKVVIECTPKVLDVKGGKIDAVITVTYPKGYFHSQALMTVTPVLVYDGGVLTGESKIYQGDGIKENYTVVKNDGGTVTQKVSFDYVPGVEKSHLDLQSVAFYGTKRIEIPTVKVADGCNTTAMLANTNGIYKYKDDGYQYIVHKTAEGQIMYDVNSANVKQSEMRSQSIRELTQALGEIAESDRYTVTGTKIVAYASPEGGQKLNAKLSDNRASSAQQAWGKISKGMESNDVEVKSVGQDWEGFKEAVANSKIQDKDLILRVLSMYSDPAVRESEIRNMSQVYTEINKKVFPELRRARFITSVDFQNFTDEELKELSEKAINALDEPALLRVASNTPDLERRKQLYRQAVEAFGSEKAGYDLAVMGLDAKQPAVAENYLEKLNQSDPDVLNCRGVVAMQRGDYDAARDWFTKSGTSEAKCNLGILDILAGNYSTAVSELADDTTYNKGLALLMDGQTDKASAALTGTDATSCYLRAVIAARKGDVTAAKAALEQACAKNPAFKERAAKDIEFLSIR